MCGIYGCVFSAPTEDCIGIARRMAAVRTWLAHRGPDDDGAECEPTGCGIIALGHTRLAIIDLSSSGKQPMRSADGRYTIVFNGEIYNFEQLRDELRGFGHRFISNSDTEVLLACWAQWGESCLRRLIGMFAFAILDRKEERLSLVRDAFGIKPLYYCETPDQIAFASEPMALLKYRGLAPVISHQRAYEYLVAGVQDDGDTTFIDGVRRVLAAHLVRVNLGRAASGDGRIVRARWWYPSIEQGCDLPAPQAAERLRELFLESVGFHLRSDVPVCIALSGGIDSSSIACAARLIAPNAELHTVSFVASESAISEESWIDAVNRHLGATSHKVRIAPADLDRDFRRFIDAQGEPVGSPSVYAQWRVFEEVRAAGFKVALEGQGGDELLGGYVGYPGQYMRSCVERADFGTLLRFARNFPKRIQVAGRGRGGRSSVSCCPTSPIELVVS